MPALAISENILSLSVQHPDRKMFDCLMPTPYGTSYNSYLVSGTKKTALIDTVDPDFFEVFLLKLKNIEIKKIDYIVLLHTEQDHSGSVVQLLKYFPDAVLVATSNVIKLMKTHLHIPPEQFTVVEEADVLDLGEHSLEFHKIPFAHWPDNTMAYEKKSGILFSSDLFGSHYASDRVFATDSHEIKDAARAYYAEIMMPFSPQVRKYTEMVASMAPAMIASAHGPVWNDPSLILKKYLKWTGVQVNKTVVIPYVSMHGSTNVIMERLTWRLARRGVSVLCRNLGADPESLVVQTGHVLNDLVTAAAVVFAITTVLGGPHPAGAYCAMVVNALRPQTRFIGLVGSYGWGTKIEESFVSLTSGMKKTHRLETLLFEGLPTAADLIKVDEYADSLADKILALGEDLL